MRTREYLLGSILVIGILLFSVLGQAYAAPPTPRVSAEPSVVQIIAADEGRGGRLILKWSGSGVLVSADGLILTNCQVAMPRLIWDDPEFDYDLLIVALADGPDQPPEAAYLAEVAQHDADLDLAVLRIVQTLDGSPVDASELQLPALPLGDSDALAAGDKLVILGYAGPTGEPVSSVTGSVTGFPSVRGIKGRAWIQTDARVEGGFSGGPAVNPEGEVVGIVAAGVATSADEVVHCRYTDETCSPAGGAIDTLRPVNLALPLIRAATSQLGPEPTPAPRPKPGRTPTPSPKPTPPPSAVKFGPITFAEGIDRKGNPVRPNTVFKSGISELYAFFDYEGMQDGWTFTVRWSIDGEVVVDDDSPWEGGESGTNYWARVYSTKGALPNGEYTLELFVEGEPVQSGSCTIGGKGPRPTPTPKRPQGDVEVYGYITDAETGRGIPGAYFAVLQPGVTVADFTGDEDQIYTLAETDRRGYYELPLPLVRGETYSMIIVAEGYRPIAEDDVYVPEDVESPVEVNVTLTRVR